MKNSKLLKTTLFVSGLIATAVGAAILFMPVAFYATYGIELGDSVSLFNEIRAPGGSLLASGILMLLGAFVTKLTLTSAVVSSLVYLSYGLSRILSITLDGMPDQGLVLACVFEIAVGLVSVFALVKYREN